MFGQVAKWIFAVVFDAIDEVNRSWLVAIGFPRDVGLFDEAFFQKQFCSSQVQVRTVDFPWPCRGTIRLVLGW